MRSTSVGNSASFRRYPVLSIEFDIKIRKKPCGRGKHAAAPKKSLPFSEGSHRNGAVLVFVGVADFNHQDQDDDPADQRDQRKEKIKPALADVVKPPDGKSDPRNKSGQRIERGDSAEDSGNFGKNAEDKADHDVDGNYAPIGAAVAPAREIREFLSHIQVGEQKVVHKKTSSK